MFADIFVLTFSVLKIKNWWTRREIGIAKRSGEGRLHKWAPLFDFYYCVFGVAMYCPNPLEVCRLSSFVYWICKGIGSLGDGRGFRTKIKSEQHKLVVLRMKSQLFFLRAKNTYYMRYPFFFLLGGLRTSLNKLYCIWYPLMNGVPTLFCIVLIHLLFFGKRVEGTQEDRWEEHQTAY